MPEHKKLSWLQSKALKLKDVEEYRNVKFTEAMLKITNWPRLDVAVKARYSFKHSGNAGDIIYSLPTIRALSKAATADVLLNLNQPGRYGKKSHPLGNVMLNEKMLEMLKPLLCAQPYINDVMQFENSTIPDYDLDMIRKFPILLTNGNISRWYFYLYGINADLSEPWLSVSANKSAADHIIIARSQRYRQPLIDYSFLKKYPKIIFIGVEEEYRDMKAMLPGIEFIKVKDFLEMASLVAGCRFFIGNQSFPFSLAEGMKIYRALEVYHLCPNVIVEGIKGYDFCYQPQFEKIVEKLFQLTA
jgi:hypothetical protein